MLPDSTKTARGIAAAILRRIDPRRDLLAPALEKSFALTGEKQRVTDLVLGTTKNRIAIDLIIEKLSGRNAARIQSAILNILRVGVYELVYCPRTARHAIVNEAVEHARQVAGEKPSRFVNAVLRQTATHIANRQAPLDSGPPQAMIPQDPSQGCLFDVPVLPNPDALNNYLAAAFSLPRWLIDRWLKEYGDARTRQICQAANRRPSVYLLPNTLKTGAEALAKTLQDAGVDCSIEPQLQMIRLASPGPIAALPGFAEGLFTVQDPAASEPLRLLDPQPGWTIVDLCAAPGTKTMQLAQLTSQKARIIATDIDDERLGSVRENAARLGLADTVTIAAFSGLEETARSICPGGADCVLLDVPCSNTGVLAKRPEVRYRVTPKAVTEISRAQSGLLERAATMLHPAGQICYSTCSIQPEENSSLIRRFLSTHPILHLAAEKLTLPSAEKYDHDGGYAAVLKHI